VGSENEPATHAESKRTGWLAVLDWLVEGGIGIATHPLHPRLASFLFLPPLPRAYSPLHGEERVNKLVAFTSSLAL